MYKNCAYGEKKRHYTLYYFNKQPHKQKVSGHVSPAHFSSAVLLHWGLIAAWKIQCSRLSLNLLFVFQSLSLTSDETDNPIQSYALLCRCPS